MAVPLGSGYRVNFEVSHLKPFSSLAFPVLRRIEIPLKQLSFGDELVTRQFNPCGYPRKIGPGCGATTHGGRHCPTCGREMSREELIESAKVGRVAAQSPKSQKKRSETQRRHRAAQGAWCPSSMPVWLNEDAYLGTIQPKLVGVAISTLASTPGISGPLC